MMFLRRCSGFRITRQSLNLPRAELAHRIGQDAMPLARRHPSVLLADHLLLPRSGLMPKQT